MAIPGQLSSRRWDRAAAIASAIALAALAGGCYSVRGMPDQFRATGDAAERLGRDITGQEEPAY